MELWKEPSSGSNSQFENEVDRWFLARTSDVSSSLRSTPSSSSAWHEAGSTTVVRYGADTFKAKSERELFSNILSSSSKTRKVGESGATMFVVFIIMCCASLECEEFIWSNSIMALSACFNIKGRNECSQSYASSVSKNSCSNKIAFCLDFFAPP